MCIDLRGGNVSMAEHLLDGPDVGAVLDQVRRKRVTERVGGNPLQPTFFGVFLYKEVYRLPVDRLAERCDEHVVDLDVFLFTA